MAVGNPELKGLSLGLGNVDKAAARMTNHLRVRK